MGYRVRDTVLDAPTIKDGTVYVGSWDKNLYAIDATTGNRKWRFLTPGNVNKPVVEDNVVYATSYYSRTYALTAENGKEIWSFITENSIGKPPVVVENLVFVIDNADKLYVLDGKTGQQKWACQQKGCSPYVLDKGMIVLACEDGLKTLQ